MAAKSDAAAAVVQARPFLRHLPLCLAQIFGDTQCAVQGIFFFFSFFSLSVAFNNDGSQLSLCEPAWNAFDPTINTADFCRKVQDSKIARRRTCKTLET